MTVSSRVGHLNGMPEDHRIPIVQQYDIRSEGPIEPWPRLIVPDGKISHYQTLNRDEGEVERLSLFWSKPNEPVETKRTLEERVCPFLGTRREVNGPGTGRWVGPTVEVLALNIDAWLSGLDYPQRPDTDGSTGKGWRLTNTAIGFGYVEFVVEPHWQVFGK